MRGVSHGTKSAEVLPAATKRKTSMSSSVPPVRHPKADVQEVLVEEAASLGSGSEPR